MQGILITRPEPGASAFAALLQKEGFRVFLAPMLEYVALPAALPALAGFQAVAFTSAEAVRIFAGMTGERSIPVFAVGDATAEEAGFLGFKKVFSAGGDAGGLEKLMLSMKKDLDLRRVLHVCGEYLAKNILPEGIKVRRVVVYKAVPAEAFSPEVLAALTAGDISTATFFSGRTAAQFTALLQKGNLQTVAAGLDAVALSGRVAKELRALPFRLLRVAAEPNMQSILDILREKEQNPV